MIFPEKWVQAREGIGAEPERDPYNVMIVSLLAALPPASLNAGRIRNALRTPTLRMTANAFPDPRTILHDPELWAFKERASKLSQRSQELVVYACVLSLLAHDQVRNDTGLSADESSIHREQAVIFARAAIEAAGVAAGIRREEIRDVEDSLEKSAQNTSLTSSPVKPPPPEPTFSSELYGWYEKIEVWPSIVAWEAVEHWDDGVDVVCWDLGDDRKLSTDVLSAMSGIDARADHLGLEPPMQVAYAPLLDCEDGNVLLSRGVSWLSEPMPEGKSVREFVAALLSSGGAAPVSVPAGDLPAVADMSGEWAPEDEVEGGREAYLDLVERSKPFSMRLESEQGWPSEA